MVRGQKALIELLCEQKPKREQKTKWDMLPPVILTYTLKESLVACLSLFKLW